MTLFVLPSALWPSVRTLLLLFLNWANAFAIALLISFIVARCWMPALSEVGRLRHQRVFLKSLRTRIFFYWGAVAHVGTNGWVVGECGAR